jgi:hypothetical protein
MLTKKVCVCVCTYIHKYLHKKLKHNPNMHTIIFYFLPLFSKYFPTIKKVKIQKKYS